MADVNTTALQGLNYVRTAMGYRNCIVRNPNVPAEVKYSRDVMGLTETLDSIEALLERIVNATREED